VPLVLVPRAADAGVAVDMMKVPLSAARTPRGGKKFHRSVATSAGQIHLVAR
jgi:hypothetical protein